MDASTALPRDDSLPSDLPGFLARFGTESSCACIRAGDTPRGSVALSAGRRRLGTSRSGASTSVPAADARFR